jgi:hypothetical protein
MWVPQAVALYPDGRVVSASVELRGIDNSDPAGSVPAEREYGGPATLRRIQSLVLEPDLARMSLNAAVTSPGVATEIPSQ